MKYEVCEVCNMHQTLAYDSDLISRNEMFVKNLPRANENFFRMVSPVHTVLVMVGMALTSYYAFDSIDSSDHNPNRATDEGVVLHALRLFAYFIFRTQTNLQILFGCAVAAHIFEAFLAYKLCLELKCSGLFTFLWTLQTLVVGYFSLGKLYQRKAFISKFS